MKALLNIKGTLVVFHFLSSLGEICDLFNVEEELTHVPGCRRAAMEVTYYVAFISHCAA